MYVGDAFFFPAAIEHYTAFIVALCIIAQSLYKARQVVLGDARSGLNFILVVWLSGRLLSPLAIVVSY